MHAVSDPETSLRSQLLHDHQRLEALMSRVLEACESDDREGLATAWTEFDAGLSAHLDTEDKLLIPNLMRTNEREAWAILSEHRHIRTRLVELGTAVDLHAVRLDAARSFIDDLRAHASHEDQVLYQHAEDSLEPEEHASILEVLATAVRQRLHAAKAKGKGD